MTVHFTQSCEQGLFVGIASAQPMMEHGHLAVVHSLFVHLYLLQRGIGDPKKHSQLHPVTEVMEALDQIGQMRRI